MHVANAGFGATILEASTAPIVWRGEPLMVRFVALFVGMMLVFSSAVTAQSASDSRPNIPSNVQFTPDLVYNAPGQPALRLDLFSPLQGEGPFPAVIFLHGGLFPARGDDTRVEESKTQFFPQAAYVAQHGMVGATILYGLAPAPRFPGILNDVQAAVRWLRAHAKEYRIDPRRIAIVGGSSGGHVAALIGMNRWSGADWSGTPSEAQVQAAVIFNGNFDLPTLATAPDPSLARTASGLTLVETNLRNFLGLPFDQAPALWRAASPISHVSSQAAPFLLLHGTDDTTVPYRQSLEMQRILTEAHIRAELFTADGAPHGFFNRAPWLDLTNLRMLEFLNAVLR